MIYTAQGNALVLDALRRKPAGRKLARSLAATRFIDFPDDEADKEWRRRTSQAIKDGATEPTAKLASWRCFALELAGQEKEKSPCLLFARQLSRLLVNISGSVFENGGLSLDRISGLPVVPGSAVKGAARRLALATLREWTGGQLEPSDPENLLVPAVEGFIDPAEFLFHVALIFGWSSADWSNPLDSSKASDYQWACDKQWPEIRSKVATRLLEYFRIPTHKEHADAAWKGLPDFAGTIAFLPAYPWEKDPGIDLDVVTCHHGEYYRGNPAYANAPDTEEPVPVIFPAIAPGQTWAFLLHPTVRAESNHLALARRWLALALETFGIGAKTNAGYGWFEVPELADLHHQREEKAEQRRQQEAMVLAKQEQEARVAANAHLLAIQPDPALLERLATLKPDQLRAAINKFHFDDRFWPKDPAEDASDSYQVSLLIFLTETQRSLYDEEKAKPKSKVVLALQKLAAKYARILPE